MAEGANQQQQQRRVAGAYARATGALCGRLFAPYQRDGVRWMLGREFDPKKVRGGFLCDEMGLGKTVQTVATMLGNPLQRTLIVAPKSLLTQWEEEIQHFAPGLSVLLYDGRAGRRIGDEAVVLAPYSLMFTRRSAKSGSGSDTETVFHGYHWDRVILDEGHEIRNPKSKSFRSLNALRSGVRWVLTGTPVFNSMRDFVTLCGFLGVPAGLVQAETDRVRARFVLRRTKKDVAGFNQRLALPPCEFENVELDMYPEEEAAYREVYALSRDSVKEILKTDGPQAMKNMLILECFLRCRQAMIHPQIYLNGVAAKTEGEPARWEHGVAKTDRLMACIRDHPAEKSIVFCQFTSEMNIVQALLEAEGIRTFRIDGSVSCDGRRAQRVQFTKHPKGCVFVIQIKSGGVGLNLQAATRVYITSPCWNPATELQAIGRSHRTGQTGRVFVKKLVYRSADETLPSIEETIVQLQGHKSTVCADVLNDDRLRDQIPIKLSTAFTIHDLKNIFHV